jgi:hypothetical protein
VGANIVAVLVTAFVDIDVGVSGIGEGVLKVVQATMMVNGKVSRNLNLAIFHQLICMICNCFELIISPFVPGRFVHLIPVPRGTDLQSGL